MLLPLSLLAALPLASWAAPMCSLKPASSAIASSSAVAPSSTPVGGSSTSFNSTSDGDEIVATTWYAGWHGDDFPPENMSWSKYSAATYAFA